MRTWTVPLELPDDGQPLFLRLSRSIEEDIRRGRLRPGDALPGSRSLALQLGIHRNTVLAALAELESQGWTHAHMGKGTFIAPLVSKPVNARSSPLGRVGFDLPPPPPVVHEPPSYPPGTLLLAGGLPDVHMLPVDALARAWRRVVRTRSQSVLSYGDAQGDVGLRREVASMLAGSRALAVTAQDVLITRGSQMALALAAKVVVQPGDRVAVEALGYGPAWAALRDAGAHLVPIPVDGDGMDVDALVAAAEQAPIQAVYVTPHHQYPTTAVLSAARRTQLLAWAANRRVTILEDDYDHEFHFAGRPVLPLAHLDRHGVVLYVGTLSKVLAPGLRLGFLVAPPAVVARATALRRRLDRQGDLAMEAAVAELMEEGELQRHIRRMRRIYQERRDVFCELLQKRLGDTLSFAIPRGGMAVWASSEDDVDAWLHHAVQAGVAFQAGRQFTLDGRPTRHLRLGYASMDVPQLKEAVKRLEKGLERARRVR